MLKKCLVLVLGLCLFVGVSSICFASKHKHSPKPGILLVAFGTSYPDGKRAYSFFEKEVKKAFPGIEVRWAYTSSIIRHKLAKEGKNIPSPVKALAQMMSDGFTHVAVQSLHTIPGEEYEYLEQVVEGFSVMPKGFTKIVLGTPLLYSVHDIPKVADALLKNLPSLKKGWGIALMGHGTGHRANSYYAALQYALWLKNKKVFLGTVEGWPTIREVRQELKQHKIKDVYLMPFMSVAGDHAHNDLAGDESDSWKGILSKAGFKCHPILKGTGEMKEIVEIWIEHLKHAYAKLGLK
ncbi:sirohydrochlorin cobaltochelatase [Desulfonauticus submarinus]